MQRSIPRNVVHSFIHTVVIFLAVVPATTQAGGGTGAELQQKVAAVKQSVAENQQKLHQYQWTKTTQLNAQGRCEASQGVHVQIRTRRDGRENTNGRSATVA